MKIYIYDNITKEYIKDGIACLDLDKSSAENKVYLMPNNSTTKKPPRTQKNESCIFNDNEWKIVKDFRGKKYFDMSTNKLIVVKELGDIPDTYISVDSNEFKSYLNVLLLNLHPKQFRTYLWNLLIHNSNLL